MGILLAIHVLVTIFLILIVLIQKNEGGSSLFANSGGNSMFNARGTSNILTKATWVLASIFLINCIAMATIDSSKIKNSQSIIEKSEQIPEQTSNKELSAEAPVADEDTGDVDVENQPSASVEKNASVSSPKEGVSSEKSKSVKKFANKNVSSKTVKSRKETSSAKSSAGERK